MRSKSKERRPAITDNRERDKDYNTHRKKYTPSP